MFNLQIVNLILQFSILTSHYFGVYLVAHLLQDETGMSCCSNPAAVPSPCHHMLWLHHLLCQTYFWHIMSCRAMPHPLWVCSTTSPTHHLQHHTATPAWGPCPQCKLYSAEYQQFWGLYAVIPTIKWVIYKPRHKELIYSYGSGTRGIHSYNW